MMLAYALMAALALLAAALLSRPWWSRAAAPRMQRRAANVAAYRTRLVEIDNDEASGLLDAESAQSLRRELDARLLVDAQPVDAPLPQVSAARWPAAVAAMLLLGFAGAWYFGTGTWRTQQMVDTARADPAAAQQLMIEAMVQKLTRRLQDNPDDHEGWAMLGRSKFVLKQYEESAQAYAKANAAGGEPNAEWMVGEGEALAMKNERDLQGRPRELFEAAMRLDPENERALWYAGMAALQAGDYHQAQQRWVALSRLDMPDEMRQTLQARIDELSKLSGEPVPAAPPKAAEVSLTLNVSLAPALRAKLPEGATLFVFAKAPNGPPMPLAVQKIPGAKLPMQVTLDDSMAMMPQLRLSQHERWVVTARLTRGGTVQAESGDLEGQIELGRQDAGKPQKIVIDRQVP